MNLKQRKPVVFGIFMFVSLLFFSFGSVSYAADTSWQYPNIVDVEFVQQHVKVPMSKDVMIIDARPKRAKYDKGHIPMSVSIPDSKFSKMTNLLPKNKDALLIFFCGGFKCKLSHKSAYKAEKLGYTNVKVYSAGFPDWMKVKGHYAGVSAQYLNSQITRNKDILIVDSRPKRPKYDKGHIPTSVSIPDSRFKKMIDQLPVEKDKPLVFYCGGLKCRLSHKSAVKAVALGYTKVKVFADGYPAWVKKYGKGPKAGEVQKLNVKAGGEEGSIDIEYFKKVVNKTPDQFMLIDVRDADEYATGTFKTAINIPTDALEAKIQTLPTNKPIVFVCSTGARSGEAYYMVQDLRPALKDVFYLEAEVAHSSNGYVVTPTE